MVSPTAQTTGRSDTAAIVGEAGKGLAIAKEMIERNDWVTLHVNGVRYLEKAPMLYWAVAASYRLFGVNSFAVRFPIVLAIVALAFAAWLLSGIGYLRDPGSPNSSSGSLFLRFASFGSFVFELLIVNSISKERSLPLRQPIGDALPELMGQGFYELLDRVYRSGESEYLVNRLPSRLRDIRDLLAGTGMGTQAYSVIEQGKVDILLQSSPKDRRMIFEEAAGISRFKARKREASRKLEKIEQNLGLSRQRLDDLQRRLRGALGLRGTSGLRANHRRRLPSEAG